MMRKKSFLYYLNPKHVSAAIETYGYAYSVKNTVLIYVLVCAVSAAGGVIFRLDAAEICTVALCGMAWMPKVVINSYKNMYEQKRFSDANLYIEQALYSFKKTPKIISALEDAEKIIPKDSPMQDVIGEAVRYILHDYSEENALEEGLKKIERKYACQRIRDAHALMLKTEKIGGDYESSVAILLSGRAIWERETCKFQRECKNRQRMVNLALMLVCGVCLFTPLVITKFAPSVDIMSSKVYKIGTLVMILVSMRTYIRADGMAAINWLRQESSLTDEEQGRLYNKVRHYDYAGEKRKSLLLSAVFAAVIALLLLGGKIYPAMFGLPVLFVFLRQDKIGFRLAKKRCAREIEKAFPQWLMEISLLLKVSDNVNAAIAKSLEEAPAILEGALREMQEQIMENPESNEPYMNFLKEFRILEIQSAMGMLYSISSGCGGDANVQISEILDKNEALLAQSESAANENRLAALYWQFLFPSIIGGGKLLVDMTLVTIAFMSVNLY